MVSKMIDSISTQMLTRYLDVAALRQKVLTANVANIDTPGYRTRDVDFADAMKRADTNRETGAERSLVREVGGLMERPDGNNVSLDRESLALAENQLKFRLGAQLLRSEFRKLSAAINEGRQG
jgi:flagellar basal-body rod protein FlgB